MKRKLVKFNDKWAMPIDDDEEKALNLPDPIFAGGGEVLADLQGARLVVTPVLTGTPAILEVRLSCKSERAMRATLELMESALGAAESVSEPYENRDASGKRLYARFIVRADEEQK